MPPLVPVGTTNRDQRSLFSSPKGRKQRPLVPVAGTNRYQRWALVPVGATNRDQRVALVPLRATNRDQWPCTAARWWEFSPTSLVGSADDLFISSAASSLSNSSELQAYGPKLTLICLWAYWASYGPESWPMVGFLVIFRPWGPSRWDFFFFVALFILFCFYLQQNTYCCYFYLFY